jgi:hypothetical protein
MSGRESDTSGRESDMSGRESYMSGRESDTEDPHPIVSLRPSLG